jgi:fatty acid synthase
MLITAFPGLAALAKVVIAMEDGAIPANLHFKSPNTDIAGLSDGRLSVVSERTPWNGGYAGINSFGFGGSNVHAILKSNAAPAVPVHPAAEKTRLVTLSGRTEEAVQYSLDKMSENASNVDLQSLLQMNSDASHPYRGYKLLNHGSSVQDIQVCSYGVIS